MLAVTGATGHIGQKLTEILLSKTQKARTIARNEAKLKPLVQKGAEQFLGSLDDAEAMTRAFRGADAVFTMIPPDYQAKDHRAYQNKVSEALSQAIQRSGIKYVVNLSSVGAHRGEGMGPVNGLHDHEERMNKIPGVNILHLRPTYFMENHFMGLGVIKSMGVYGTPLKPDIKLPMIATQDIAEEAAERLIKRDFSGKSVKYLLGQRDLSMQEVTQVLGSAIGKKDLKYMQFPYSDAEKAMLGMGLSPDTVRLFIEMNKSMNEGIFKATEPRSAKNTTRTPIEEFAKSFAAAYQS